MPWRHVLCQLKWKCVANMHARAAGASTSENDERFAALMAIQNVIELAMCKDNLSLNKMMRLSPSQALKALY